VNKKVTSLIVDIIFYMMLILMIVIAVIFSRSDANNAHIGGYRLLKVLTSSMQDVYPRGSIILVKNTPATELVIGDDITFISSGNKIITHRIHEIEENFDESGERGFVTKGVNNPTPDADVVIVPNVIGKVVKSFPKIGAILGWVGEHKAITVIFLASLLASIFFLKIFWREKNKEKTPQ